MGEQDSVQVAAMTCRLGACNDIQSLIKQNRSIRQSFSAVNQVSCYSVARIPKEKKQNNGSFPQDQILRTVEWQTIPTSRYSFINKTLEVFTTFQSDWAQAANPASQNRLLNNASNLYQQEILRHVRDCSSGNEASLFAGVHAIWHLAHITCFDNAKSGTPASGAISGWMRLNFTDKLTSDFQRMNQLAHPSQDSSYWPLVYTCVLRGFFDAAVQLLSHLSVYQQKSSTPGSRALQLSNPVLAFQAIAKKFPKLEDFTTNSAFKAAWTKWNQEVSFLRDNGAMSSLSIQEDHKNNFLTLFSIMEGIEDVVVKCSPSWQDAFSGLLLFSHPLYDFKHLSDLVVIFKEQFASDNILDRIQWSLLEQDLGLTIALCVQFDWWLVTHLVDLLEKSHLLDALGLELGKSSTVSEWYLLNYAESLFAAPKLWKASMEYLNHSGPTGKRMLEELISMIPLDSEEKTSQVLEYCESRKLKEGRQAVLRILGSKALKSKDYEKSINYYLLSNDLHNVGYIVDLLVEKLSKTGDLSFEKVAASLSSESLFKCNRLAFLSRYHEFHSLYKAKEFDKAANLLVLLLTSGLAPKKFWKALLVDSLPLLEGRIQVFTTDQIMELMRCTESCFIQDQSRVYKPKESDLSGAKGDVYGVLRLALSRALAASLISQ